MASPGHSQRLVGATMGVRYVSSHVITYTCKTKKFDLITKDYKGLITPAQKDGQSIFLRQMDDSFLSIQWVSET